jgi:hypothetical protein
LCLETIGQVLIARRFPPIVAALIIVEAGYWTISYVLRPLLLLLVQPAPAYADPVADPRLANGLGYDVAIRDVLIPVVLGQGAFIVVLLIASLVVRSGDQSPWIHRQSLSVDRGTLIGAMAFVWLIRLAYYVGFRNSIMATLLALGPIVIGLSALYRAKESANRWLWVVGLVSSEVVWSLLFRSKTPFLGLVVAFILAASVNRIRLSPRRIVALALLVPIGLLTFATLQANKTTSTDNEIIRYANSAYPGWAQPLLPVVRRFDLFEAVTDAVNAHGEWIGSIQAVQRLGASLVPNYLSGGPKTSSGLAWGAEVRNLSLPTAPGVSLADGPIAEGYAIGGIGGAVVEATIMALLTILVGRMLYSRSIFFVSVALSIALGSFLFERGLLGFVEAIGKAWQVAVVIVVAFSVTRDMRLAAARQRATPSVAHSRFRDSPRLVVKS